MKGEWAIRLVVHRHNLFDTLLTPFRKFGPPYPGKATTAARAALPTLTSACWIFSCFCNPPNSDKNYRIFNVRTRSLICVRMHTGVGYTDSKSAQVTCLTQKSSRRFSCALDGPCGTRTRVINMEFELESDALPVEPPRHSILTCMLSDVALL